MKITISFFKPILFLGISFVLIGCLILVAESSLYTLSPEILSLTITIDLLITIPLIYYLLIKRTKIPLSSVSTVVVLGLVVGIFIIPHENQNYLNFLRIWFLPVLELSLVLWIIYQVRKALNLKNDHGEYTYDFFSALKYICYKVIPKPLAGLFATEISVVYYGLVFWKKRKQEVNEFSYHRNNATISTLVAVIFILAIETLAFHVLLMDMSNKAAWILTFCSLYTIIQVLGILKSIIKRPISIGRNTLNLNYGIIRETSIDLTDIESVKVSSKELNFNKETKRLSPLGAMDGHNIVLELSRSRSYSGFYGLKRKFRIIAFYVDEPAEFISQLEIALNRSLD